MENITFRSWLQTLEKEGTLKRIKTPVSKDFEIAALGKQADAQKTTLVFENVKGFDMPVAVALASSREQFAKAMGVQREELNRRYTLAQNNPRECVIVDRKDAPVMENINEDVDLSRFPIPIHHAKDGGDYVTAGILISKNKSTGEKNVSIHRLQVLGKNKLGILILPRHLDNFYREAEARGEGLELAIAIGVDPLTLLASQAIVPLGYDELTIASALHQNPLGVVRCKTVDIEVPAAAEIVLEGKLVPHVRELEGPFGEYPRYYGPKSPRQVIELSCVCHRNNPIYHTIVPATMEHFLLGGIAREAGLIELIRNIVPTVVAVNLTEGGSGRYHLVISIDKKNEGEGKNAIFAALGSSAEIKHVVCVDSDIDIFNMTEVEWAIATRVQASKDVFIVPDAMGNKLDPSCRNGISDKMGIDATVPIGTISADSEKPNTFERISIPNEGTYRLEDYN